MLAQDHVEGVKEGKGLSAKERGIMRIGISPKTDDYCWDCRKSPNIALYRNSHAVKSSTYKAQNICFRVFRQSRYNCAKTERPKNFTILIQAYTFSAWKALLNQCKSFRKLTTLIFLRSIEIWPNVLNSDNVLIPLSIFDKIKQSLSLGFGKKAISLSGTN